jgi:hypothetical protein
MRAGDASEETGNAPVFATEIATVYKKPPFTKSSKIRDI